MLNFYPPPTLNKSESVFRGEILFFIHLLPHYADKIMNEKKKLKIIFFLLFLQFANLLYFYLIEKYLKSFSSE
jgi:hypothetical protein